MGKDDMYYEIEYDASPIPGVGKFVPKPQKIREPERDEIRDLFGQMRDLARVHRSTHDFSRFFDRRVYYDNAAIFYKQGLFMKDFTDDYVGKAPFSQYFPYYQMMGYEQLRTYFTWRTAVRTGTVSETSLSYAFLYIYELLGNIGVSDPQDGLDKLLSFWHAFRVYHPSMDKYVLRWLKDYHIYYALPQPFHLFIQENKLIEHYPGLAKPDDSFDLFCATSKYDIRKSAFFTEDRAQLIADCFTFVTRQLRQICQDHGIHFEDAIFQPTKKMSVWPPFQSALFYPRIEQPDRRVVLSEHEIYLCSQNRWTFSTVLTSDSGRQLIGYIMKRMESVLRRLMNYKYKLSASLSTVSHPVVGRLREAGTSLEAVIDQAVLEFYREATKTVVKVDPGALSAIRREALATQEKLIIPEQEAPRAVVLSPPPLPPITPQDMPPLESLKDMLTETERQALSVVLHGEMDLKVFADTCGIMLEVLADGINEKAMDTMGDNLLDADFALYDDYREQVKELIA
ncbi:MAG: TerB N-terminal domain-containing protein [Oscillospiraceae bacterium]|nr:TerB N-terminal domain-containing protein [Oscillospiraceae bacterium]